MVWGGNKKRRNKWYFYKSLPLLWLAPSNNPQNMCGLHKLINMIEKTNITSRRQRSASHPFSFQWLEFGDYETSWMKITKPQAIQECNVVGSFLKFRKPVYYRILCPEVTLSLILQLLCKWKKLQKCGSKQAALMGREMSWKSRNQSTHHLRPGNNIRTFCLPSLVIQEPSFKYHSANEKNKWGLIHFWWVLGHDLYPNLFPTTPICSWKQKASR